MGQQRARRGRACTPFHTKITRGTSTDLYIRVFLCICLSPQWCYRGNALIIRRTLGQNHSPLLWVAASEAKPLVQSKNSQGPPFFSPRLQFVPGNRNWGSFSAFPALETLEFATLLLFAITLGTFFTSFWWVWGLFLEKWMHNHWLLLFLSAFWLNCNDDTCFLYGAYKLIW